MVELPPPPVHSFASDNAAGVSPAVLDALVEANVGTALAYGDDDWTRRMQAAMREVFDAPVMSFPCWGGTGANTVGLASVLHGWQAVIAADTAHIVVDECGAPVRFSGSTIVPIPTPDGKLRPDHLEPYLHWLGVEHHVQPRVVSITQSTEMGTLYTVDEIGALGEACHANGLLLHLDGARLANALVALGTDVPAMVRDTGVDVLTFGLTKDGAMYGETVVFVDPALAEHALFIRKQAGQLPSKARFVSAQVLALLEGDLWLRNAEHANAMAQKLMGAVASIPGVTVSEPPAVNAIFPVLPADKIEALQAWSFFWPWDLTQSMVRWMTSFATTDEDVDRFAAGVRAIVGGRVAVDVTQVLQDLSDQVYQRLRERLEGLTDEEYLWEPAPGCWTIRPRPDGTWADDMALPSPAIEPLTTIAWRLWHVIDCYGEDRAPTWLGLPPQGPPIGLESGEGAPPSAVAALALLDRAHARWDAHLALVDDDRLAQPVGPVGGPNYADHARARYVLHMLDEFIHHGAEIGVLRDLWRWQHPLAGVDATHEKIIRGDRTVLDDLGAEAPSAALVVLAANEARWELMLELVARGASVNPPGRTALHLAAGAGRLDVVEALLAAGADPSATDDVFHATPEQWADFLHQPAVVARLQDL